MERSALTAGVVHRAEQWRWDSFWVRDGGERRLQGMLSDWPLERPGDSLRLVNQPMTEKEVERIRTCSAGSRSYGSEEWQNRQAKIWDGGTR